LDTNLKIKYITEEATKELEKCDEKLRMIILAYAMLIVSKEDTIELNRSHIEKAYKKFLRLNRLEESKIKWFIFISSAILLPFAFLQISLFINPPQMSLLILPIAVILWVTCYGYIFRDFL
jgi:hypothetical protein